MCCAICASCLATCCAHCCCSDMKDCKAKKGPASRIPYMFVMFVMSVFAILLKMFGKKSLYKSDFLDFKIKACKSPECAGNAVTYRVSFCLLLFFIVHAVCVKGTMFFHYSFFMLKFAILFVFTIVTFWMPNEFFEGYAEFARAASLVFLLIQIVVYLDWAWRVNDRMVLKIQEYEGQIEESGDEDDVKQAKAGSCCLKFALIGGTLLMAVLCVVFVSLFYGWFGNTNDNSDKASCALNETLISLTLIILVIVYILSFVAKHGSIFATSIVAVYATYLCWAGLSKTHVDHCNAMSDTKEGGVQWVGLLITVGAISYLGFSVSSKTSTFGRNEKEHYDSEKRASSVELEAKKKTKDGKGKGGDEENQSIEVAGDADSGADGAKIEDKSNYDDVDDDITKVDGKDKEMTEDELEQRHNVHFHIVMAFAAIYLAMIYTDWSVDSDGSKGEKSRAQWSKWVNIVSQWVTFVLYVWTLLAPMICPGRFEEQEE